MQVKNSGQLSPIGLTAVMLKIARYLSSKFDSSFIPIYGYFDGAVPISVIRPAKSMPASVPALNDLQLFSTALILRNRQPEISDHQQSHGYEDGPWKGPGPPLLVAADF